MVLTFEGTTVAGGVANSYYPALQWLNNLMLATVQLLNMVVEMPTATAKANDQNNSNNKNNNNKQTKKAHSGQIPRILKPASPTMQLN